MATWKGCRSLQSLFRQNFLELSSSKFLSWCVSHRALLTRLGERTMCMTLNGRGKKWNFIISGEAVSSWVNCITSSQGKEGDGGLFNLGEGGGICMICVRKALRSWGYFYNFQRNLVELISVERNLLRARCFCLLYIKNQSLFKLVGETILEDTQQAASRSGTLARQIKYFTRSGPVIDYTSSRDRYVLIQVNCAQHLGTTKLQSNLLCVAQNGLHFSKSLCSFLTKEAWRGCFGNPLRAPIVYWMQALTWNDSSNWAAKIFQ